MVEIFEKIMELKNIREGKTKLLERENDLSSPLLTDLKLIPEIYKWFSEIISNMDFAPCLESAIQRKKFLFIILFLYCPIVLASQSDDKDRLPNGMRKILADVFFNISPSRISHYIEDITFWYLIYPPFHKDIDYLYTEIINRLRVKELIN